MIKLSLSWRSEFYFAMIVLIKAIDGINEKVGKIGAWATTLLVWMMFILVVMRYGFGTFSQKGSELNTYFFAIIFLFGSGYAFLHDKHVRVDLFYSDWTDKRKAWINLLGGLLFLIPWCIVAIKVCFKYAWTSFERGEVSDQPSGLPAVYILKFILVLGFLLLLLQGISSVLKSICVIKGTHKYSDWLNEESKQG